MEVIELSTREEYLYAVSRGYEPLADPRFDLPISLRYEIQNEKFTNDIQFYRWRFENSPQVCEETGTPLYAYSSRYVSHILSRGAWPVMRYDYRNINILRDDIHTKYENATAAVRASMRIYRKNQETIALLKREYALLNIPTLKRDQ
jgi:hypothetical protein